MLGNVAWARSVVRVGAGIAALRVVASYLAQKSLCKGCALRPVQSSVSTCLAPIRHLKASERVRTRTNSQEGFLVTRARPLAAAPSLRGPLLCVVRARGPPDHFFGSRAMGMQKNCKKERCVQARGAKYWGLDLRCITSLKCGFSRSSSITHVLHMNSLPSTVNVEKSVPEFLKSCEISPCKMQWKTR